MNINNLKVKYSQDLLDVLAIYIIEDICVKHKFDNTKVSKPMLIEKAIEEAKLEGVGYQIGNKVIVYCTETTYCKLIKRDKYISIEKARGKIIFNIL